MNTEMRFSQNKKSSQNEFLKFQKQQLELEMEQTGSKLEKEYVKTVYGFLAYLTYVQSTSCEMLGQTAKRNINNLGYADDTNLMAESEKELKTL